MSSRDMPRSVIPNDRSHMMLLLVSRRTCFMFLELQCNHCLTIHIAQKWLWHSGTMALSEWLGGRPRVKDAQGWWETDASLHTTWRGQRLDWGNQLREQNMASSGPPDPWVRKAEERPRMWLESRVHWGREVIGSHPLYFQGHSNQPYHLQASTQETWKHMHTKDF